MHVDALTLAAVADEWRRLLTGARIDTIIQPTEHAIALQCYCLPVEGYVQGQGGRNRWVYLSAHPQMARAHLTMLKPPKIASEPPPFVMLLRKYLEGARVESIGQPRWERVIEVVAGYRKSVESEASELGEVREAREPEFTRFRLIIEIMGRLSNIILCNDEGMILGSLKRVASEINRYRVVVAGVPYVPPPPQQRTVMGQLLPRLEPTTVTAAQLSMGATSDATSEPEAAVGKKRKKGPARPELWQTLTRHLLGCSALQAQEIVYRTTGATHAPVEGASEDTWEELAWNVRDLTEIYDSHEWHPQLVERVASAQAGNGQQKAGTGLTMASGPEVLAFATYRLEQYSEMQDVQVRQSPSINVLLDEYYARAEWRDAMDVLRSPMRKVLQAQFERCQRKAEVLRQSMEASEEAASYRLQGDLLLAHQHAVQQGQASVEVENFFEGEGGALVTIALDPRFDAVGNANRFFNKYHKLRRALNLLPAQIEQNNAELATVEQLLTDLALAENPAEVQLVKAEVQTAGYIRGKALIDKKAQKAAKKGKQGKGKSGKPALPGGGVPLHMQSRDGFTILIGKNSRQNEEVTFHQATANDIWLHARGVPGAHVIIKAAGREVPRSTIEQAASVAAYYSQSRGSTTAPVDYTLQRHVRHMKGGGPGMVIYERERTVYATPSEK